MFLEFWQNARVMISWFNEYTSLLPFNIVGDKFPYNLGNLTCLLFGEILHQMLSPGQFTSKFRSNLFVIHLL